MNKLRHRPLAIGALRAFEAVARHLNFRAAGEELHLTQSAVSRQIKALEGDIGAPLFARGTRHVELTLAGQQLQRSVLPLIVRLDTTVRQIRSARGRRSVSVTTFASFASLWLIPRLAEFQRLHPDIDIRILAVDQIADFDDPDIDLAMRHCLPARAPANAQRLFGEVMTPMAGAGLATQAAHGQVPPLATPADLAGHTLLEDSWAAPSSEQFSWRYWLRWAELPQLEPQRWLTLSFTHQQVQAALAGQGVALARLALVVDTQARGELVELFGPALRLRSPYAYWLVPWPGVEQRDEVRAFMHWVLSAAAVTRAALGEDGDGG